MATGASSSKTSTDAARAAALKDEGNKLYVAKNYRAAHAKYSEAIEVDGQNAVLWANRAACAMAMTKLLDAESDCEKATKLDPKYTKAWARLGTIRKHLGQWDSSLEAYREALQLLPASNKMSQADKNIQRECEMDIDYVKNKMKQFPETNVVESYNESDYPWDRVLMIEDIVRDKNARLYSSRWILLEAAMDFNFSMQSLKHVKQVTTPDGRPGYAGHLGAMRYLVKALITEQRAFRIEDPRNYPRLCNLQAAFEAQHDKAIIRSGGAENIIAEVIKLKEAESWDVVRPAINTTVRAFVLRAFHQGGLDGEHATGVETYRMVIDLIQRCKKLWKDVPKEERGEIFDDEFLRGVRRLKLDLYLMAHKADPNLFPGKEIFDDAQEILRELDSLKGDQILPLDEEPAAHMAFYVYPRAQALTSLGLYYREQAQNAPASAAPGLYQKAADHYLRGAETYPEDDETHAFYLTFAFDALVKSGTAKLSDVLALAQKLRGAVPKMRVLWEHSAMSASRDVMIKGVFALEEKLLKMKQGGRLRMGDRVVPEVLRR